MKTDSTRVSMKEPIVDTDAVVRQGSQADFAVPGLDIYRDG
jgi:hypothetical protein